MTDRLEQPSGPLDVPTLEVLAQRGASYPIVSSWAFRPDTISLRVLELELDSAQYPDRITEARMDIRWFVGGDYTVHYLEFHADSPANAVTDDPWQCRWDRHPKLDAPRAHFHPPPDASSIVEPSPIDSTHHLDVLFGTLEWVVDRIERVHE